MKSTKKTVTEVMEKLSPHLQNSTLFYGAAAAVFLLAMVFVAYPTYEGIATKASSINQIEDKIETTTANTTLLTAEYNDLSTRINKMHSEADEAIAAEVLPEGMNQTELVRYFERKVQELNTSSRDFLTLNSISFGKEQLEGDYAYVAVKLSLTSSDENFYRFMQVLEQAGLAVLVQDVEEGSAGEKAGFKAGDVIEAIVDEDRELTPTIFPWVLSENLKQLEPGEKIVLQVRRYDEVEGAWVRSELTYTAGDYVTGSEEASTGLTLQIPEDYSRQMVVMKVSSKLTEGDEITGEGSKIDFTVDLNAYYKPSEEEEK